MISFEPLELLGDPGAGGERGECEAEREEELDSHLLHCYQGEVRVLSDISGQSAPSLSPA